MPVERFSYESAVPVMIVRETSLIKLPLVYLLHVTARDAIGTRRLNSTTIRVVLL